MDRHTWIRGAEILLLLPATVFLAPMAAASALGMMFAIVQDVRLGVVAELMLIGVMVSFLGAIVGMISLWTAMVVSTEALAGRRTLRVALLIGIAVGIADAFYWLWTIGHEHGTQWSAWLLMLIAPIILGARYARRLVRLRNE